MKHLFIFLITISLCFTVFQIGYTKDILKPAEDSTLSVQVQSLLGKELSLKNTVQIALLQNPALQAKMEDSGIAQADLLQAGLLRNPIFSASIRFSDHSHTDNDTEFSVTHNFFDIFLVSARKKLAAAKFEKVKLSIGETILQLCTEVKSAYYTLVSQQQLIEVQRKIVQAAQATEELAQQQFNAGNISELELSNEKALYHQTQLELAQNESEILISREKLNRLMGFKGQKENWTISDTLPDLSKEEPSVDALIPLAIKQRLDLETARQEAERVSQSQSLAKKEFLSKVEIGVASEHETDGTTITGPVLQIPIPLFDRNQTSNMRFKAQLQQSQQNLASFTLDIESEVHIAHDRLAVARNVVKYYRDVVLPLREQIVNLSQTQYNAMTLGVYTLLQAKQNEMTARQKYIESLRDYWIAHSEIEQVVGGELESNGG